jgi:hypothetical protein
MEHHFSENPSPPASPRAELFADQGSIRGAAALRLLSKLVALHQSSPLFDSDVEPVLAEFWCAFLFISLPFSRLTLNLHLNREACAVPEVAASLVEHGAVSLLAVISLRTDINSRTQELALGSLANLVVAVRINDENGLDHAVNSTMVCFMGSNKIAPLTESARAITAGLRSAHCVGAWLDAIRTPDVAIRVTSVLANALEPGVAQRFCEVVSAAVYADADVATTLASCGVVQALTDVVREQLSSRTTERSACALVPVPVLIDDDTERR